MVHPTSPVRAGQRLDLLLWPLSCVVVVAAAVRGASLTLRPNDTIALVTATAIVPLQAWGAAFLAVAGVLLAGLFTARRVMVAGHSIAFVLHLAYAAQIVAAAYIFGAQFGNLGGLLTILSLDLLLLLGYLGLLPDPARLRGRRGRPAGVRRG